MARNHLLNLLDCFTIEKPELGISEISRMSGCPKQSAARHLKNLESAGFLRRDPVTKKYSLGYKIYRMYDVLRYTTSLQQVALKYMERARDAIGETVTLYVLDGMYGVCIERAVCFNHLMVNPTTGIKRTLNAGASRKVLLAFMPDHKIQEVLGQTLMKFTENTVTDPEVLLKELDEIRRRGYAVSKNDVNLGIKAVSVPIRHKGSVIGSISSGGPVARITKEKEREIVYQLQEASQAISRELGG